jgi:Putative peptidoglycan binding domain
MKTKMKKLLVSVVCLLTGLIQVAWGQQADTTPQRQEKIKTARVHASPHSQSIDRRPANNSAPRPAAKVKVPNEVSYAEALQRYRHVRHDRFWWDRHFTTIVFAGTGYYYWDAGYWYPAWGYDPVYDYYDYNGPIYTYGNLLPDQVILNVQRALQQLGYYAGALNGSLGPASRQALAYYQRDFGLNVNGVIDAPTVASLGLD